MEPASFTVEQIPRVGSLTRAEVEALRSGAIPDGWPQQGLINLPPPAQR